MALPLGAAKAIGRYFGKPISNIFKNPATGETEVTCEDGTTFNLPENRMALAANNSILGSAPWADEYQVLKNAMAQQSALKQAVNTKQDLGSVLENELHRHKLIAMRLRLREGECMPFQDLFTSLAGDKVFVFVVQDNQAVTFEDTAAMFPSDTLITQLRLLEK